VNNPPGPDEAGGVRPFRSGPISSIGVDARRDTAGIPRQFGSRRDLAARPSRSARASLRHCKQQSPSKRPPPLSGSHRPLSRSTAATYSSAPHRRGRTAAIPDCGRRLRHDRDDRRGGKAGAPRKSSDCRRPNETLSPILSRTQQFWGDTRAPGDKQNGRIAAGKPRTGNFKTGRAGQPRLGRFDSFAASWLQIEGFA
jgi:hypothetical protein